MAITAVITPIAGSFKATVFINSYKLLSPPYPSWPAAVGWAMQQGAVDIEEEKPHVSL